MSPNRNPQSQFPPPWLPVIVNILIALVLVGSYLYLYLSGNVLAWRGTGKKVWPDPMDPILETILGGVGGVVAAVFAVALNLPSSAPPRTLKEMAARWVQVLTFWAPWLREPPEEGIDWEQVNNRALLVCGVVLTIAFPVLTFVSAISKLFYSASTPEFILNFAGAGAGVLVGAFAVWAAKITGG